MQLITESNPITTQGLTSIGKSTIRDEDMAIALSVLRDRLYSDPIKSICREIMSNALDANREVGTNKPIEVTLPTHFNPNLLIRDDGPGLSPERMENFKNFFSSSKRDSNTQRGAFGLGSKSPWSYTTNYSIITTYNGIEYTYTCVIDDSGQGDTFLAFQKPTNKSNGTTISIPVKGKDCVAFRDAVLYYSQFFKPTPIVHNSPTSVTSIPDFTDYILLPNVEPTIIVGDVPYPLEQSQFQGMAGYEDFRYVISRHNSYNQVSLVIKVDIGTVSLIPSREAILYDSKTKSILGAKLHKCFKDAIQDEVKNIQTAPTYLQAVDKFITLCSRLSNDLSSKLDIRYNGVRLKRKVTQECRQVSIGMRGQFKSEVSKTSMNLHDPIYVDCDDVRLRNKACRTLLKTTHRFSTIYLIPPDLTELDGVPLDLLDLPKIDEVDIDKLLADANLNVEEVEPEVKERTRPLKTKTTAKTNIGAFSISSSIVDHKRKGIYKHLLPIELALDTPRSYIVVDGGSITDGVPQGLSNIDTFLSFLRTRPLDIVALKEEQAKRVVDKWTLASDLIDNELDKLGKEYEDYFIHELYSRSSPLYCPLANTLKSVRSNCIPLGMNNSFTRLWDYWQAIETKVAKITDGSAVRLLLLNSCKLESITNNPNLGSEAKRLRQEFNNEFPLLAVFIDRCRDTPSSKLTNIIVEELTHGSRTRTNP